MQTLNVIVKDFKVCSNAIRNCHVLSSSNGDTHHILISGDSDLASVWRIVTCEDCSELQRVGYDMRHDATVCPRTIMFQLNLQMRVIDGFLMTFQVFLSCFASAQGDVIATVTHD